MQAPSALALLYPANCATSLHNQCAPKYMNPKNNRRLLGLLFSALSLSSAYNVKATTFTWTKLGPVSAAWSDTSNWQGGVAPVGSTSTDTVKIFASNTVVMTGNVTGTNDIANPLVVNRLQLSGVGGTSAYTVTLMGSDIQLSGTSPSLILDGKGGTQDLTYDVYNNFQLTGSTNISSWSWGINNLRGSFNGTGPLVIGATCKDLLLFGTSSYTGSTTVTGGSLYMATNNALPATTDLTIASGALLDLNAPWQASSGGNLTIASLSGSGVLGNNNNATTRTLTISGGPATVFAGALTAGSGTPVTSRLNVVVTGSAQLTLTGTAHTYTGTTTVSNGGVLAVDGKLAATPITVNNGGSLCGTGTIPGSITVNSGGSVSGGDTSIGVLSTGTQTWKSGSHVIWAINSGTGTAGTNWDQINSTGAVIISSSSTNPMVFDVNTYTLSGTAGPMANFDMLNSGTWTLVSATNGITNFNIDTVALNTAGIQNAFYTQNLPMGEFVLSSTANQVQMTYTPSQMSPMGIYVGGRATWPMVQFETWLGRQIPRTLCFNSYQSDWSGWYSSLDYLLYGTLGWENSRYDVTFSLAMLPASGTSTSGTYTNAIGATGAYNSYWTSAAQDLINHGEGNAIIRLGWEMNGNWYPWEATNATDYINYWIQIVNTMRAVPGANFKFDYCPAVHLQSHNPLNSYPGDAYVDIIGLDVYNTSFTTPFPNPEKLWNELFTGNYQIQYWTNFAISHHKKISFPEWATGFRPYDSHGGGDDPYFVRKMYEWISSHNSIMAYHDWWNTTSAYNSLLCGSGTATLPKAGAVYRELFGQEQYWDQEIGSTGIPGTSSYDVASKTYTIKGAGPGISGTADSFHFLFTPKEANCTITAKITSIGTSGSGAMGGVMVRQDINPSGTCRYVFAGVKDSNLVLQYRDTPGAAAVTSYSTPVTLPTWVRIVRTGTAYDQFAGYVSSDGTNWSNFASQAVALVSNNNYAGVALASGTTTVLNTGSFANVNVPIEIIQDNTDASGVTVTGTWVTSSGSGGWNCYGTNFLYDNNLNKGSCSVTYTPTIPEAGNYNTYIWYSTLTSGTANNLVPVTITSGTGTTTMNVNQCWGGGNWIYLGTFPFNSGTSGSIVVSNAGTTLKVSADAVRFYKAP